jgi:hypothetical protein
VVHRESWRGTCASLRSPAPRRSLGAERSARVTPRAHSRAGAELSLASKTSPVLAQKLSKRQGRPLPFRASARSPGIREGQGPRRQRAQSRAGRPRRKERLVQGATARLPSTRARAEQAGGGQHQQTTELLSRTGYTQGTNTTATSDSSTCVDGCTIRSRGGCERRSDHPGAQSRLGGESSSHGAAADEEERVPRLPRAQLARACSGSRRLGARDGVVRARAEGVRSGVARPARPTTARPGRGWPRPSRGLGASLPPPRAEEPDARQSC